MRDIGQRIRRYRLSRYAVSEPRARFRFRWAYPLLALWLVYVGVLSEHSLVRIWRMSRDNAQAVTELDRLQSEIDRLGHELRDPAARKAGGERALRERVRYARPGEIIYSIEEAPPESLSGRRP
ncbi:MAG TPA: septum formation initiator family protein [Candidatus Limnocylindria bacterium]|nr:septum formation initiator family protein [Candidatus Limnocylindria bacterium]